MLCHSRLGAVWVLLAAAAAFELYDELAPELDGEFAFQDVNDIDTGPPRELHVDEMDTTRFKDLLLFRLIMSLRDDLRPEHRIANGVLLQAMCVQESCLGQLY